MNRFQWNLRYPYATEITGYHAPIAAGGLEDSVVGPVVVPGTYSVTLDYGGQKAQQNLAVALDPRLHATQQNLASRLSLDLEIHSDLDTLDKDINRALAARDKLQKAVSSHSVTDANASPTLSALNRDIDSIAQRAMKSSEGSLLYETKLRDHLAYLASVITSKAAKDYHFKTGQRDWPSGTENVLPCRLLWWQVGFGAPAPRTALEHMAVVQ